MNFSIFAWFFRTSEEFSQDIRVNPDLLASRFNRYIGCAENPMFSISVNPADSQPYNFGLRRYPSKNLQNKYRTDVDLQNKHRTDADLETSTEPMLPLRNRGQRGHLSVP